MNKPVSKQPPQRELPEAEKGAGGLAQTHLEVNS